MSIKSNKAVRAFVGLMTGVALSGAAMVLPLVAQAETFNFATLMKLNSRGTEVMNLQKVLNMDAATQVSTIGAGSPGNETTFFGAKTKAAVIKFQRANGLVADGIVGSKSRAVLNTIGDTGTGTGTGTTVPGTDLVVALSADTPLSGALIQGQAVADLAHYTFTNKSSVEAKVTGLAFNRTGIANDATLSNVYVYEGARRLTDAAAVSQTRISFNDLGGILNIPAGTSKTIAVKADVAASTAGQIVGVSLSAITANVAVSSTLPIGGHVHSIASATLAGVNFASATSPTGTPAIDPQDGYVMWQNTVSITTRAVDMKSFALRQIGSVGINDLRNFKLFVDGVQVGTTVASLDSNGMLTFDLTSSPVRLQTGSRIIKVLGDVVGGSTRTFSFSLRQPGDAMMVDTELGQPVLAQAASATFSARTTGTNTINSGTLTITKKSDSPSGNVTPDASNVVLGRFEFKAAGEPIKVENLLVTANVSTSGVGSLRNGAVFANGVQVGSTAALTDTGTGSTQYNMGSSLVVMPGSPVTVEIRADVFDGDGTAATFASGDTITASIAAGSSNLQRMSSLSFFSNSATAANQLTVATGALAMSKNQSYGNQTTSAPKTAFKIGAFTLTGGSAEGVNLDTITVNFSGSSSTPATQVSDVFVKYGAKTTATKASVVAGDNAFSINELLAANQTLPIEVYGTLASTLGNTDTVVASTTISGTTAQSALAKTTGSVVGQTITVATGAIASSFVDDISSKLVIGGTTQKVASFKFTATNDTFKITEIAIKVASNNAAGAIGSISLRDGSTILADGLALSGLVASSTGLSLSVAPSASKTVDVYYTLNTVATGFATTTANVVTTLEGFRSESSVGTQAEDATDRASDNNIYVVKTRPTIAKAMTDGTLVAGAGKTLTKVAVTADAAGPLAWKKVVFNVDKTSAITIGATSTLKLYEDNIEVAGVFATTTGNLLGGLDALGTATSDTISFVATNAQTIGAGSTKTYELRGTVGGIASGNNFLSISIPALATTVATPNIYSTVGGAAGTQTPSFVWSDQSVDNSSESTADWLDDFLIGVPTQSTTLSVNI